MVEPQETEEKNNKACLICGENIRKASKKCIHCDSFQNWKRHLNLSTSFLSLMIALISVFTLSLSQLKSYFKHEYSDLAFAIVEENPGELVIIASNTGTKPASIGTPSLDIYHPKVGNWEYNLSPSDGNYLVASGEFKQIKFLFDGKDLFLKFLEEATKSHEEKIDEGGTSVEIGFDMECILTVPLYSYSSLQKTFTKHKKGVEEYKKTKGNKFPNVATIGKPPSEYVNIIVNCQKLLSK